MAPAIDAIAPRNSFASIAGALLDDCWTHNKFLILPGLRLIICNIVFI